MCVHEAVSRRDWHMGVEWMRWGRATINKGRHHPICRGPEEKKKRKGQMCLSMSWTWDALISFLGPQNPKLASFWTPGLTPAAPEFLGLQHWTESYMTGFSGSGALKRGLSHTTGIPGSPACRRPVIEFLRLHNHVSQFP